jgi:hypothetical protein
MDKIDEQTCPFVLYASNIPDIFKVVRTLDRPSRPPDKEIFKYI